MIHSEFKQITNFSLILGGRATEQQTIHFSTSLIRCGKTLLIMRVQMKAK